MSTDIFTYTPALPNPDWEDPLYMYILADAEEERGNTISSLTLRFIAETKRIPFKTHTAKICSGTANHISTESYDWIGASTSYAGYPENCKLPDELIRHLPHLSDVAYSRYIKGIWVTYWSLEDAYLALINTCIGLRAELVNGPGIDKVSLIYHPA